jgi:type IX secretion system PorP/SprF family membrane protein
MIKRLLIIFSVLLAIEISAQHYQFSQYYAASTYLNPAFTGAGVCSRLSTIYRNQWSGVPGAFETYQITLDHSLAKYKSGIGLQLFKDNAGPGGLNTTQLSLLYAYETKLNKKFTGRGGLNIGTVQRKVDFSKLTFGDQIYLNNQNYSVEGFSSNRTTYFDAGAGVLVFSKYMWAGASIMHLNQPNQSFLNGNSALPREIKIHGGYKYFFDEEDVQETRKGNDAITFTFNYKHQKEFNQLDIGLYYTHSLFQLGIWYRGIPLIKTNHNYQNSDAAVLLFGLSTNRYRFGYSYDITVSRLNNNVSKGSHELSIAYQLCNLKSTKKKKADLISCPKF